MARYKSNTKIVSIVIFVIIIGVYSLFTGDDTKTAIQYDGESVNVHFIDVGQGDGAVIQTPDGNILIDAGLHDTVDDMVTYIDSLGVTEFEYAIFTHPHADHIGGAATLLSEYEFGAVIMPNAVSTSKSFEKMIDAIEEENCEVIEGKAGVSLTLGGILIDLLGPVFDNYDDLNNTSVVTKLTYGDISFLFTGDAEERSELAMLNMDMAALDSTILKVGHHGSNTSSCEEFLAAVTPEVAIYSCGLNNEYGHPHREVVSRINDIGADSYRTDKHGTITVETDGKTYSVSTEYSNN